MVGILVIHISAIFIPLRRVVLPCAIPAVCLTYCTYLYLHPATIYCACGSVTLLPTIAMPPSLCLRFCTQVLLHWLPAFTPTHCSYPCLLLPCLPYLPSLHMDALCLLFPVPPVHAYSRFVSHLPFPRCPLTSVYHHCLPSPCLLCLYCPYLPCILGFHSSSQLTTTFPTYHSVTLPAPASFPSSYLPSLPFLYYPTLYRFLYLPALPHHHSPSLSPLGLKREVVEMEMEGERGRGGQGEEKEGGRKERRLAF